MSIVHVEGLRKIFGQGDLAVEALKDVSFSVEPGELMALLGPSGSGKSTLLLCISLIQEPSSGRITMNGRKIYDNGWTGIDVRRFRRENIGFIFQAHNLIPFLNARDNIAIAMEINGVHWKVARKRALELLDYLDLSNRATALPTILSGGEQQRVAIGRALANSPSIIFADEPTASLDTMRGTRVMELLKRIASEQQTAVITVTHDIRMIEGFDSLYHIVDGRLVIDDKINH
ncbi:MAG: ABC transporter ATP-binding protein [Chlorobium sp.]|jgi:putative ABC transport system ATP-binding protein|uniref:ABC transporter ATP-binding protein n=1 Tax=Chlorobium sp. TaxID=1095 RepID=UPI001D40C87A|nr:ABC transporter ATP-binding protein [Chlorobium sp.]MBN1278967.1 ABC transporter ATP-binding protein [Chlorobiaceae bacterium]MCF8216621.1 ABC transporter ATP-binding protein [Chlorobium sp.]MCF8271491.1 ABC transporter ATP-binding protein [Chlorobium sp.]MCF8287863.1 ABC transporter ATP-binding protein [Chlorobium sp.]MCF8291448.1 ABC transporter ATP-binding protein [Chlorobium sp.]